MCYGLGSGTTGESDRYTTIRAKPRNTEAGARCQTSSRNQIPQPHGPASLGDCRVCGGTWLVAAISGRSATAGSRKALAACQGFMLVIKSLLKEFALNPIGDLTIN